MFARTLDAARLWPRLEDSRTAPGGKHFLPRSGAYSLSSGVWTRVLTLIPYSIKHLCTEELP